MELEKTTQQIASISTQELFLKQLFNINYLIAYPISDMMLEGWYDSIKELTPEMSIEDLKTIIDRMKVGAYTYDSRVGIQNIFKAYGLIIDEKISIINKNTSNDAFYGHFKSNEDEQMYKENKKKLDYFYEIRNRISKGEKPKPRVYN